MTLCFIISPESWDRRGGKKIMRTLSYQVNSYLLVLMEGNDLVTKAAGAGGSKMNR